MSRRAGDRPGERASGTRGFAGRSGSATATAASKTSPARVERGFASLIGAQNAAALASALDASARAIPDTDRTTEFCRLRLADTVIGVADSAVAEPLPTALV